MNARYNLLQKLNEKLWGKGRKNKLCKSSQKIFGAIAFECFVRRQFYIVFLLFWAGKDGDEVKVIGSSKALVLSPTTKREQKS